MEQLPRLQPALVVARALQSETTFIGIAGAVCDLGQRLFGLHQVMVSQCTASGRPFVTVDNLPHVSDEVRVRYLDDVWVLDPLLQFVRQHHGPVGDELMPDRELMRVSREIARYDGDYVHTLVVPILEPQGLIGVIACGHLEPVSIDLRRDLTALGTHVSVRLAQLGITASAELPGLRELTVRQFDVAQLAALGRTNAEIARLLQLSENTVKKHLKSVFGTVGVANRTMLAARIRQVRARDTSTPGITRIGSLTITRAAS